MEKGKKRLNTLVKKFKLTLNSIHILIFSQLDYLRVAKIDLFIYNVRVRGREGV